MTDLSLYIEEELPLDDATVGALIRAEGTRTRNLMRRLMTDLQAHLDADVAALTEGIGQLESEINNLKNQPAVTGSGIDFTGLDNVVAGLKSATASIAAGPASTEESGAAAADPTAAGGSSGSTSSSEASASSASSTQSSSPTGSSAGGTEAGGSAPAGSGTTDGAASSTGASEPAAKTLYEFTGTGSIDSSVWSPAGLDSSDGKALYTFSGDTAPGDAKGASTDWVVYTGPTTPVAGS